MTSVELFRSRFGQLCGFHAGGHAGYMDYGEDIVCAAISALTQAAILGLTDGLGLDVSYSIEDGDISMQLPEGLTQEQYNYAHIILDTMRLGLLSVSESQPGFLVLRDKRGSETKH